MRASKALHVTTRIRSPLVEDLAAHHYSIRICAYFAEMGPPRDPNIKNPHHEILQQQDALVDKNSKTTSETQSRQHGTHCFENPHNMSYNLNSQYPP